MKKNLTIVGALTLLLMLTAQLTFAQTPGPGGPPVPAAVPLDGGLSLLLAAGAAFGAKALRARK